MIVEKEFFIRNSLCCTAANNNNSCNVHTVVPGLIMEQNKKKTYHNQKRVAYHGAQYHLAV